MSVVPRALAGIACALAVLGTAGCASLPKDPHGTLQRIRTDKTLTAGASPADPWIVARPGTERPTGTEARLVEDFAARQGARVTWVVSGEQDLVQQLEKGEIDLLAGGLTADTPWVDKVALTRPYARSDEDGETAEHVLAVPMGENALLVELERYLDEVKK